MSTGLALLILLLFCGPLLRADEAAPSAWASKGRLFFTSQGKTGIVNRDGSGLRYFDFSVPGQATWQPGPVFPDGRRVVFLSMEPRRDGPGRPFAEYYTQTPTHLWECQLDSGSLCELVTKDRLAPFITPMLMLGDGRLLVQVVRHGAGQVYSLRVDGSDAREFTRANEGMPYGFSLSPDGRRVAFHLAGPRGYEVWTSDTRGGDRVRIAAQTGHLFFGPSWSPDGRRILFVDCQPQKDPGHDWGDVCVGRPDGSPHRVVTQGRAMWFAATYGNPQMRGGGSNLPSWTHDGQILFPKRSDGAKVAWEFQPQRTDVDHFNRDFKPALAQGGSQICRLNPRDDSVTMLTPSVAGTWDFRACESSDGRSIAFCRATTGGAPSLLVMDADGSHPRVITHGLDDRGVDHPKWLP